MKIQGLAGQLIAVVSLLSALSSRAWSADFSIPNEIPRTLPAAVIENGETLYGSVRASDGTLRRVIVTKPKTQEARPTVIFIGGLGCFTFDEVRRGAPPAYMELIKAFTRSGWVTVRVEKSGMGDSQGRPCMQSTFKEELSHYEAATRYAAELPFVDSSKMVIFGHSMGGVFAPLLASEYPFRAVIAMATLGQSWISYEQENSRRQSQLAGESDESIDSYLALYAEFQNLFYRKKMALAEIKAQRPDLSDFATLPASETFMRELADLDVLAVWKTVRSNVYLFRGAADFMTSSPDHVRVVQAVRTNPASTADFYEIPWLDHFMTTAASEQDSFNWFVQGGKNPQFNWDYIRSLSELVGKATR